ncbi:fibronectin type III domain-containing protein [Silanimonas sp.]|uniref:RCC1 domain-containing protein n=1 Tax=Silanimonas sp. TaxID=1929290 RepID=UPI0037C50CD2
MTSIEAIAAGDNHTCALTTSGQVRCWGEGNQTGDGVSSDRLRPGLVKGLSGVTAIAAGGQHTCALTSAGQVFCWGENGQGQLGNGTTTFSFGPVLVDGLVGVTAIAAGAAHTCAVISGGNVRCWGGNANGQLGDGSTVARVAPVAVSGLNAVAALAAGDAFTCARTTSGALRCWGLNQNGQLGDGTFTQRLTPVPVSGFVGAATALAAGGEHACAINAAREVLCWGLNAEGQLGLGNTTRFNEPVKVGPSSGGTAVVEVIAVAAGKDHTCVIGRLNVVGGKQPICWGRNHQGQLGNFSRNRSLTPDGIIDTSYEAITAGDAHTCALREGGTSVRCWGGNANGEVGDGTVTAPASTPAPVFAQTGDRDISMVTAGLAHTCARTAGGTVRCWGQNTTGQLGDGTTLERLIPVTVSGLSGVVTMTAGTSHTCALTTAGEVRCWGDNFNGALGDGTTVDRLTPVAVGGLTGVTEVAAGGQHTCARTADGRVFCWGSNIEGQLGDGTRTRRTTPVAVLGLGTVTAISAGQSHTCVRTAAAEVRCWGRNSSGQLGDGTLTTRLTPVGPGGLSAVTAIAAGVSHTCARNSVGEVRCWGEGTASPVLVSGLSGVSALSAGGRFTCALDSAGQLLCWGLNNNAQLGNGTTTNSPSFLSGPPTVVSNLTGVASMDAGSNHACAVTDLGGVQCWGANTDGQRGDGRATNSRPSPATVVDGLTSQTINFPTPATQRLGTAAPTLTATATSGLAVSFSSGTTEVCTITSAGRLTLLRAGPCAITARQAGNVTSTSTSGVLEAVPVTRTFGVIAGAPDAPTGVVATAGDARATVAFVAPSGNGALITSFTVTSNPSGITRSAASSPITVTGLTNGTAYTFTVVATNLVGPSPASAPSNSVTPSAVAQSVSVLLPDRAVLRENSPAVEISVLANDEISTTLESAAVLTIATPPTRGTASVVTRGTTTALDDVIRYVPNTNSTGTDTLAYRVCFGAASPCLQTTLTIEVRPLGVSALEFSTTTDRGFRDEALSGLRALPSARFEAHGLVEPVEASVALNVATPAGALWGPGLSDTRLVTLAGGTSAREWRVLVDAGNTTGGDLGLYVGIDTNGNGQADESEVLCSSAMGTGAQRCDFAATAPANGSVRYWVLSHSRLSGQTARIQRFETPLDVPEADRSLTATGPGALAANATFNVRLAWNDPTLLPGGSRGGWIHVRADDGTSLGWIPVRINRTAGEPMAFALRSGVDLRLDLAANTAHERLYIDVPPGTSALTVTTQSAGEIDVYLARVPPLAASAGIPIVAPAPARAQANASGTGPGGNERVVVANPAPGRWYVTPVNEDIRSLRLTVNATVVGSAPVVRAGGYFNPQRSGNGLFLYPAGGDLAGLFYTFLQDGSATWYYLQGTAPGANGLWRGTLFRSAWNGRSNRLTAVGEATVTPTGPDAFTFTYAIDGETGSEAYAAFGRGCPNLGGSALNVSGHWFDPATAGTGYSVQLFPNYEFYLVFAYDERGIPRFLIAERPSMGAAVETLNLEQLTGTCPLCERAGNGTRSTIGTFRRSFTNGSLGNISVSGRFTAGVTGNWAANDAVIPLGGLQGCAP